MIYECDTKEPIQIKNYQSGDYILNTTNESFTLEYNHQQRSHNVRLPFLTLGFEVQKIEIFFEKQLGSFPQNFSLSINGHQFKCTSNDSNSITFDLSSSDFEYFRLATNSSNGLNLERIDTVSLKVPKDFELDEYAIVRFFKNDSTFVERQIYFVGYNYLPLYHPIHTIAFTSDQTFDVVIFINDVKIYHGKSKGDNNVVKLGFSLSDVVERTEDFPFSEIPVHIRQHFFNATYNYLSCRIIGHHSTNKINVNVECNSIVIKRKTLL